MSEDFVILVYEYAVNSHTETEGNIRISNNSGQATHFQELIEYDKVQQQTNQPFINTYIYKSLTYKVNVLNTFNDSLGTAIK